MNSENSENSKFMKARINTMSLQGILITLLSILPLPTIATYAQVIPLDSLIALIDSRNPMLKEYDHKVTALTEYAAGAKSWMAPMVGLGTFMTPYPGQTAMEQRDKGSWMISFEQEIPNPTKLNAAKTYLQSKAAVEREGRSIQLNLLKTEVKADYAQWLVAERKITTLLENKEIVELMIKLAKIRYPYNQGSLGSIYKTEARLAEVENMIAMAQSDIENAKSRIKAIALIPPTADIHVDTSTVFSFDPARIKADTAALPEQRSDIRQINESINVMRLNQELQRNQSRPDFKIRFDHMQPIGNMPSQFTAMAMISIPIAPWSSRMYKAEIKGMQQDIEGMTQAKAARINDTKGMLTGMAAQITRMEQQLNNYTSKIIPALQKNHETLMLSYEENREELPMVIDGWEALSMTQLEYFNKLQEYYNMIIAYESAIEK